MNKIVEDLGFDFKETVLFDSRSNSFKAQVTDSAMTEENKEDNLFKRMVSKVSNVSADPVLLVSADVSHTGYVNDNFRYYDPQFGAQSSRSWTKPYAKPVLIEHRKSDAMFGSEATDPIGRIIHARYVPFDVVGNKAKDLVTRKGVQRVYATISGKDNIEKVMDGRYLTISVSGNSKTVKCSICNTNLKEDSCEHELGVLYDNKLAYMIYDVLSYHEWSYVNVPADVQAKNNRWELIGNVNAQDSLSSLAQIENSVGAVANRGKNNDGNLSIYFLDKSGTFFDLLPNNIDSDKIETIIDGGRVFECQNGSCQLKGNVNDVSDNLEDNFNDTSNSLEDQNENIHEEDNMNLSDIKSFEDLATIPFVKKAFEDQLSEKYKDIISKVTEQDTKIKDLEKQLADSKSEIETKSTIITELETKQAAYDEKEKDKLVDALYDLQLKTGHSKVVAIDKKEEDTKAQAIADYKAELKKRDIISITDSIADIKELVKEAATDEGDPSDKTKGTITATDTNEPKRKGNGNVSDSSAPAENVVVSNVQKLFN